MLPFKICAVAQGSSLPVLLANAKKAKAVAPIVEMRADTVKGFREENIGAVKKVIKGQSIFTFRHKTEGGEFTGDIKLQKAVLKKAFHSGFSFIDVAYGNKLVKELSKQEREKLILSYHEFDRTSSPRKLKSVLNGMRKASPAVIKIATMIKIQEDVLALAEILKLKKPKENFIVIGMGQNGKLTRVLFPMMGSYLTYVSMEKSNIAPGLMTKKELEELYNFITKS